MAFLQFSYLRSGLGFWPYIWYPSIFFLVLLTVSFEDSQKPVFNLILKRDNLILKSFKKWCQSWSTFISPADQKKRRGRTKKSKNLCSSCTARESRFFFLFEENDLWMLSEVADRNRIIAWYLHFYLILL